MRILIPVLNFDKTGGYRVLSKLADNFIEQGNEVVFLVPLHSELPYFPTKASIVWCNTKGRLFDSKPKKLNYNAFKIFISLLLGIRRLSSLQAFDVIIANQSFTTFPVFFAGTQAKKIYYIQAFEPEMYFEFGSLKNYILGSISKLSYRLPFLKIVNSGIYCNHPLIRTSHIVYPGLDLSLFHAKNKSVDKENIVFGTIWRDEPTKGSAFILEAYHQVFEKNKNISLVLCFGKKELLDTSKKIATVLPTNDAELAAFYKSVDVYISAGTIQHGAVHYPVIESMACATTVITTPYYPANESNSYLIKPSDSVDIAEKMILAINNQNKWEIQIKNGLSSVRQFDWPVVSKKMLQIISDN